MNQLLPFACYVTARIASAADAYFQVAKPRKMAIGKFSCVGKTALSKPFDKNMALDAWAKGVS